MVHYQLVSSKQRLSSETGSVSLRGMGLMAVVEIQVVLHRYWVAGECVTCRDHMDLSGYDLNPDKLVEELPSRNGNS